MIDKKEEAVKELRKYEAYQKLLNLNGRMNLISERMHYINQKRMQRPRNKWHFHDAWDIEYIECYEHLKKLKMKFNKIRMQFNIPCIRSSKSCRMIPILILTY